jgi:3-phenylpropionate/trans-cinnamate dioxygenase ferredoxin reductase subunit
MRCYDIVIIGGGHGGVQLSALLRQYGFQGSLLIVSEDDHIPYQRPPLSKDWLKGELSSEDLAIKDASFYKDNTIDLDLGTSVLRIDKVNKRLSTCDQTIGYEKLVLATGTRLRSLPDKTFANHDAKINAMSLYDLGGAQRIKQALGLGGPFSIIGGGYIGLELAATARLMGHDVRVFERDSHLLARTASMALSDSLQKKHESMGVEFHFRVNDVLIDKDQLSIDNHSHFYHRHVIIGIGALANDQLARESGLSCENGIVVNDFAQTTDESIYAIGDVSLRPHTLLGRSVRLESVPSALEQARILACHLTNRASPAQEVPWFWSDQYDFKIQIAGLYQPNGATMVKRCDDNSFSILHLDAENVLVAAECVNRPADFMAAKQLIHKRISLRVDELDNPQQTLKSYLT